MKVLCSLWLCLGGKGEAKVVEQEATFCHKVTEVVFTKDGNTEGKRVDSEKQRFSTGNPVEDRDSAAWRVANVGVAKSCEAGKAPGTAEEPVLQERQSFLAGDLHNERTLRALLQKAKARLSEQTQAFALEPQAGSLSVDRGRSGFASDPELGRLNSQLLETCSVPKPDARTLLRLELLLGEVRRWLAARPCPAAATSLLYAVGDGLVHAEHAVRSVGLVRYWQPDNTSVFLALLQLYSDLLVQATHAAQLHRQQQQQQEEEGKEEQQQNPQEQNPQQQQDEREEQQNPRRTSGSDVLMLAADQEQQVQQQQQLVTDKLTQQFSEMSLEYSEQGLQPRRSLPTKQQRVPLTFAAAALLLRPDWLDMLADALELLHFSEDYRLAAIKAGREPQEALAKALQLWCFLTQLVRFAATHADSVQRMEPCLQRLNALLAPPSGTVPRLLDMPLAEDTLVAQLHALWLLQVLYDMPDAKMLYSGTLADYYVALHHNAMVQSYQASAADPKSAAAELCRIHATLLRSMARHPGTAVRGAFTRVRTVEWILQELSLESQLLASAQQDGEAEDPDMDSDSASDSEITVSDNDGGGDNEGGDDTMVSSANAGASPRCPKLRPLSPIAWATGTVGAALEDGVAVRRPEVDFHKASKRFSFTYDLNEDVERLIALEDELGREMELDGFEYDDEGKELKARSDARQAEALAAEAAAAEAAAAGTAEQPTTSATAEDAPPESWILQRQTSAGPRDLQLHSSIDASSCRSSGVPRLALTGMRAASISSMAAHSPGDKRSSGQRARTMSAREDGEDTSSDEARTPSPHAAAAAERVAVWSSSLEDAYAAASSGDDSKLPYPPPRPRSRGSGTSGVSAVVGFQPPSSSGSEESQQELTRRPASREDGAAVAASSARGTTAADEQSIATSARPREITTGSPVHAGPQGELHLMVQSSGTSRATQPSSNPTGHGRPPLPTKPSLPPLKVDSAAPAAPALTATSSSPSTSARAPPPGSSRAMMVLSASNRITIAGLVASSPNASQQQQQGQAPWGQSPTATPAPALSGLSGAQQQLVPSAAGSSPSPRRPPQPLIPALNLKSLRRREANTVAPPTDTGRTVPLSSMLRFTNGGSLSNCSGRDSANTLLRSGGTATTTASDSAAGYHGHATSNLGWASGVLRRITETEQRPPEVAYQELACQRLLYQDRATHILLLKVLVDLLVAPWGALDPAYVPQYPIHSGVPHAEFILLWHLNAPRNACVVHDLCRGAQRRARQAAAAAVRRAAEAAAAAASAAITAPQPVPRAPSGQDLTQKYQQQQQQQPTDSARDYSPSSSITNFHPPTPRHVNAPTTAEAATIVAAPTRAGAVTRALQLLSRPLFDTTRYTNLQFVARGAFGDIYRARIEPPRAQAWLSPSPSGESTSQAVKTPTQAAPMQVIIKTIQLPSSPHDSCVLADVFGEVSVMERFIGHECICQLLDYGMRDDSYWLVMRRYRCSLAEWRGRQKPLSELMDSSDGAVAAAAAARMYLSALLQVVDALRLLASHHVVHFDLKCSNVLIEPQPGVRDGELWAPVGTATNNSSDSCVPFCCVLADFGEARAYRCAEEAFTARNRGTEVFKSPEMLLLNAAGRAGGKPTAAEAPSLPSGAETPKPARDSPSANCSGIPGSPKVTGRGATAPRPRTADAQRQRLAGAGLASDIWSLGCLAYELLTGTVLFGGDYASVTHRVAFGSGEQLALTDTERARLANMPELVRLVEWILVRDPSKRPSLDKIRERVEHVRSVLVAA